MNTNKGGKMNWVISVGRLQMRVDRVVGYIISISILAILGAILGYSSFLYWVIAGLVMVVPVIVSYFVVNYATFKDEEGEYEV